MPVHWHRPRTFWTISGCHYTPYIGRAAEAQITVDVYEGHVTPVDYKVPFIVYMAGTVTVGQAEPLRPSAPQFQPEVQP